MRGFRASLTHFLPELYQVVSTSLLVRPKAVLQAAFAALALAFGSASFAAEKYELAGQPAPDLLARGLSGQNVRIS